MCHQPVPDRESCKKFKLDGNKLELNVRLKSDDFLFMCVICDSSLELDLFYIRENHNWMSEFCKVS